MRVVGTHFLCGRALSQHLTVALKDNTADFRKFGLDSVVDMLEAKPEQEQALLTMVSSLTSTPPNKRAGALSSGTFCFF